MCRLRVWVCLVKYAWESAPAGSSQWTLPVNKCMDLWLCVCVWHSSGAFPSCQWKTLVSCPHKAPPPPPRPPFPCLFNSVHQHFLLWPVSVTLHFLRGLNRTGSPQSARFWVSLKRQRASKSITAFLIFINLKTQIPPPPRPTRLFLPQHRSPPPSLRGISYSKEGGFQLLPTAPVTHLTRRHLDV